MIKLIHIISFVFLAVMILFLVTLNSRQKSDSQKHLKNLQSGNVPVIQKAIYHLGKEKEIRAVNPLIAIIKASVYKDIKIDAIRALGNIGSNSAVNILILMLNDPDIQVKYVTVEALGKIRDPRAVKPLIQVLPEPSVCLTVIWALGNIADKTAVDSLTPLLKHKKSFVRFNASQSLKKIGQAT